MLWLSINLSEYYVLWPSIDLRWIRIVNIVITFRVFKFNQLKNTTIQNKLQHCCGFVRHCATAPTTAIHVRTPDKNQNPIRPRVSLLINLSNNFIYGKLKHYTRRAGQMLSTAGPRPKGALSLAPNNKFGLRCLHRGPQWQLVKQAYELAVFFL